MTTWTSQTPTATDWTPGKSYLYKYECNESLLSTSPVYTDQGIGVTSGTVTVTSGIVKLSVDNTLSRQLCYYTLDLGDPGRTLNPISFKIRAKYSGDTYADNSIEDVYLQFSSGEIRMEISFYKDKIKWTIKNQSGSGLDSSGTINVDTTDYKTYEFILRDNSFTNNYFVIKIDDTIQYETTITNIISGVSNFLNFISIYANRSQGRGVQPIYDLYLDYIYFYYPWPSTTSTTTVWTSTTPS